LIMNIVPVLFICSAAARMTNSRATATVGARRFSNQ
jgi:hypothetical protein